MHHRNLVPELMDDLNLSQDLHHDALSGLRRVNFWSGTANRIAHLIARHNKAAQVQVLDIGCGGGDVTIGVHRKLRQAGIDACVTGWDMSDTAIDFARKQAGSQTNGSLQFQKSDAIEGLKANHSRFDFIYCSLFLHHFADDDAVELLSSMRKAAKQGVIIDDLRRTSMGLLLAKLGCQLLSRSKIVHFDGPQSVRAAYTNEEVLRLAQQANMQGATINNHWPQRFALVWLNPLVTKQAIDPTHHEVDAA